MNGINVGKAVNYILRNNTSITDLVDDKIFPLVAHLGTTYPFITYIRSSVLPADTKDKFICGEISTVQISCVSNDYEESVKLANVVQDALNGKEGIYNGVEIKDIKFDSITEDFIDDAYIQIITYKIYLI